MAYGSKIQVTYPQVLPVSGADSSGRYSVSRRRAVNICVGGVWVKNSSYIPSSSVSVRRRLVGSSLSQPAGLEIQAGGAPSLSQEIICIMFLAYVPPV